MSSKEIAQEAFKRRERARIAKRVREQSEARKARSEAVERPEEVGRVIEPPKRTVPDSEVYEPRGWRIWLRRWRPTTNTAMKRVLAAREEKEARELRAVKQ